MKKRVKAAVLAAIVLCAAALALIYTRPRTLAQRYPLVDLADCTSIEGDYSVWQGDEAHFAIEPGDPDFDAMLELLRSAAFRTRLANLFPAGTKYHVNAGGDFHWTLTLRCGDVTLADGSVLRDAPIMIDNFYGDTELCFDGRTTRCTAKDDLLRAVLEIAERHAE